MGTAIALLVQHGYLVLFAWVAIEQLGAPLPSSPLMIAAGALSTSGQISASWSVLAVVLGCVTADTAWYFVGRRYGDKLVRLICLISFEPATCVRKTEASLGKYGARMLLFAKFVPGLNVVAAPIAGQSGVPLGRFLVLDLLGGFAWAITFVGAGRVFGESVSSAGLLHVAERFALILFVVVIVALLARRLVRHRAFVQFAERWRVTANELKSGLDRGDAFHIVDLRPARAIPAPTLPGAHRQSASEVLANLDAIPRDRDVILFCGCPGESAAVALAKKLRRRGLLRVRPLEGGPDHWRDEGYPLV